MSRVVIPDREYKERAQRAAKLIRERGLDVLVVNGTESDYANPRYFSGFWPVFERSGVAINPAGETVLMVGPESDIFAADVGKIKDVFVMLDYRESADPAYPHIKTKTFRDVFEHLRVKGDKIRIGVASILDTNVVIWQGLQKAYPEAELVDAGDIMVALRSDKSEAEIACLREAARITKLATEAVIAAIRPGMTELQLVGIAQQTIYANGAEYEGLPMYCFSQASTKHAISRSGYRQIQAGDIVQLNLSAKIDGYSPSIGMPISMGKLVGEKRRLVEFLWDMHKWTTEQLAPGVPAAKIAREYEERFKAAGYGSAYVYGPCHGLGMIEVEAPWMETSSTYELRPNMTFQVDTFGMGSDFGVRWEKPVCIREGGVELLSPEIGHIYEIE
ncbi:MAG: aminopeptidase P family protein [Clostridiaceae bacterium]|nr:aminopeptidase P family protein [Clostridiaceae bacterium]